MDPFQRDFEDEYALQEMIQEGTQAAGCFQEIQNEDDGSQYLNDTGDGDADTMEEMHVEDDIPEVYGIRSQNMTYLCIANVCVCVCVYNFRLPD